MFYNPAKFQKNLCHGMKRNSRRKTACLAFCVHAHSMSYINSYIILIQDFAVKLSSPLFRAIVRIKNFLKIPQRGKFLIK